MLSQEELYSFTPLMNSFLLEWKEFTYSSPFIIISTKKGELRLELKEFSLVGHHRYSGKITLNECALSFEDFLELLNDVLNIPADDRSFISRVKESHECILESIKLNGQSFKKIAPHFRDTETALFIGHSLHPTPKSRSEFSREDLSLYSPEHGGIFQLEWMQVHKSIFFQRYSNFFSDLEWQNKLCGLNSKNDFHLLPLHPWQKKKLLELKIIQEYLEKGLLKFEGVDERKWIPTSSLRTIYNEESPYMIKFSLSLKMTNSVRHLLVHELERGLQIHEVSQHSYFQPLFEEFPHFKIIQEPYYAGITDAEGEPITESLIMLRENPIRKNDEVSLIATLTQPTIQGGESLLQNLIQNSNLSPIQWFTEYLNVAIAPLLVAQGEYGLLLGAHQQNLVLKFTQGKPSGAYFRDCHGTGYDMKKIAGFASEIEKITEENGNLLPEDVSHYLFGYYVIINSVFNMISAIAQNTHVLEKDLLEAYGDFLRNLSLREKLDPAFVKYLLERRFLKHKGNFFCTVRSINENTTSNPLNIYTDIENPLLKVAYGK